MKINTAIARFSRPEASGPGVLVRLRRSTVLRAALVGVMLLVQGMAPALQAQIRLPDLGSSGEVLPPDEARTFPTDFRNAMRAQGLLVDDPIIEGYFTEMGHRLVMHSDGRDRSFHFHVLRIPGINAFAAPAGVVALNGGLILAAESADEVAGVVAHEISHVTQNHLSRSVEEAQRVSLPVMLATLGLVLVGSASGAIDGEAAQGILATGSGIAQQAQINYTRQNEAEADRVGIQLMARAGYDPTGMADFFNTLNRWSRSMGAGPPEYLRTHPLTVSRVAEARERADRLAAAPRRDDPRFELVRARLRVVMSDRPSDVVDWFERRLASGEHDDPTSLHYGLGLALLAANRLDRADDEVEWLLDENPDDQLFRLLEGEVLLAQGQHERALAAFESLWHDYGQSAAVALAYAESLLHDGDPENAALAAEILRERMRREPDNVRLSELLAHAADRAGDPVRAAEAVATNYYQRGGLPQAIEQLERVLGRDDLDYYDRARISARLDRLRVERLRLMREEADASQTRR